MKSHDDDKLWKHFNGRLFGGLPVNGGFPSRMTRNTDLKVFLIVSLIKN